VHTHVTRIFACLSLSAAIAFGMLIAPPVASAATDQTVALSSIPYGGSNSFNGLLRDGTGAPAVAVVLLHGRGSTSDGPVVHELRISLNDAGYTTFSLDEPVPAAGTAFSDYISDVNNANYVFPETYARVRAAIDWLHTNRSSVKSIVVLGFSMGSRMTSAFMAYGGLPTGVMVPVVGYVGIGMYATSGVDPLDIGITLPKWTATPPVLDLYGSADTNAVDTAQVRRSSYMGASADYTQFSLPCASTLSTNECHQLVGLKGGDTMPLETNVAAWMACHAPLSGTPVCQPLPLSAAGSTSGSSTSSGGGGGAVGPTWLLLALMLFSRRRSRTARRAVAHRSR